MFEKVKSKLSKVFEENNRQKEERERIAKEEAEELERKEIEKLQVYKDLLSKYSEKELIIEAIIVLKEQKEQMIRIEQKLRKLEDQVETMDIKISGFGFSIEDMKRMQ